MPSLVRILSLRKFFPCQQTPPPSFNRQVDPLLQSLRTTRSASTSTRPSPSTHHHHHTLNGRHDASDGGPQNGGGTSNTLPYSTSGAATPKATLFGVGGKGGYSSTCDASFPPFGVSGKSSSAPNLGDWGPFGVLHGLIDNSNMCVCLQGKRKGRVHCTVPYNRLVMAFNTTSLWRPAYYFISEEILIVQYRTDDKI